MPRQIKGSGVCDRALISDAIIKNTYIKIALNITMLKDTRSFDPLHKYDGEMEEHKMSKILEPARQFYEACESGKGWEGCKQYCHPDATFSAQAGALEGINTVEGYTEWMKGLLTPIPDGHYELRFFAEDEDKNSVAAYGVFHGTNTGPGGPEPPTGKTIAADYVYVMEFEGNLIRHLTKIWNDAVSLRQLGWA